LTERPDIFDKLVVDLAHGTGNKKWILDHYLAFKAIDVKHFMFECTLDGKSKTDQNQMLSVSALKFILER
jgi:3-deoxy-D-arabino-heptulosonate 7-phosphate (DAHP) synthase